MNKFGHEIAAVLNSVDCMLSSGNNIMETLGIIDAIKNKLNARSIDSIKFPEIIFSN